MTTTTPLPGQEPARPRDGVEQWAATWERVLPALAVAGPGSWFVAALIRAAGIGTLGGDLDWISRPEGFIMVLGVPCFVATFLLVGRVVAERALRAGVTVTALGLLGLAAAGMRSGIRLFMGQFTDVAMAEARGLLLCTSDCLSRGIAESIEHPKTVGPM